MEDGHERRAALLRELDARSVRAPVSDEQLLDLAARFNVPASVAFGLRTFYFPDRPVGPGEVCVGLPCAMRRTSGQLAAPGPEWARVSCLGYCARAPVARRGGYYVEQLPEGDRVIPESRPDYVEARLEHLAEYRLHGGYDLLEQYLTRPDPDTVLARLESAGLRGMGGAGFPSATKWKAVRASPRADRLVLVNAHEGEPATFKDREILEITPHRVLEGALLAALVVGATEVVVGLKSEYENASRSLEVAVEELTALVERTWPGRGVPKVSVRTVPGPYVTGEETALMEAIEGRRSEPRPRPPFPAEVGLFGRPTLVQNVETLAIMPALLRDRPDTGSAPSVSKLYCLTGDVARPGIYRHPLGVPASELVEKDGGLPADDVKAFLPGGLSGGLLPAERLPVPLEFDAVRKEGAGLGTGAVIVIGRDRCLVDLLHNLASFFAAESCGKCVPCRLGTAKLERLLDALRDGRATEADLEAGLALGQVMQETSICALGQVAGKALADAMKYFPSELLAHTRGICPARQVMEAATP